MLGRHVLVVEGHHLRAARDLPEHLEVAIVAHDAVGYHLRRRDALGFGEQSQRDAQGRRRLGHHPRELAAADHGDDGREVWHEQNSSDRRHPTVTMFACG